MHQGVADAASDTGQFRERRRQPRARLHAIGRRQRQIQGVRVERLRQRARGVGELGRRNIGGVHDVAGFPGRIHQRGVGILAAPFLVADGEGALIAFGEQHVVADHLRAGRRQVVDHRRMHQPRPRPSSNQRFHAAQAFVVDRDEDDVLGRCRRARSGRDTHVVGLQLDGANEVEKPECARQHGRGEWNGSLEHGWYRYGDSNPGILTENQVS